MLPVDGRIVSQMKTASLRDLKPDSITVLGWVPAGEPLEIQKRGKPVAILSRPAPAAKASARPDLAARLKSIYGDTVLATTTTELLSDERGDRWMPSPTPASSARSTLPTPTRAKRAKSDPPFAVGKRGNDPGRSDP